MNEQQKACHIGVVVVDVSAWRLAWVDNPALPNQAKSIMTAISREEVTIVYVGCFMKWRQRS